MMKYPSNIQIYYKEAKLIYNWIKLLHFIYFVDLLSIYLPILPPVKCDHYRQAHVGRKEGRGRGQ